MTRFQDTILIPLVRNLRLLPLGFCLCIILAAGLGGCAETTTKPAAPRQPKAAVDHGLREASRLFEARDYEKALKKYDGVIGAAGVSANTKRLAYLGKALIYLGNAEKWHNLDHAKLAISDAAKIKPADGQAFSLESNMLRDAVMALAGSQSAYDALQTKTSNTGGEIAQLKKQRDALIAERDALNQALEKLKELTLKN